jgi:hypothetical protein
VHDARSPAFAKSPQIPVVKGLEGGPDGSKTPYAHLWITLWIHNAVAGMTDALWHCANMGAKISKNSFAALRTNAIDAGTFEARAGASHKQLLDRRDFLSTCDTVLLWICA